MLARAIVVLSCLFCTRVLAQASAAAGSEPTAPANNDVGARSATPAAPKVEESVQSAVPVDREALAPTAAPGPERALDSEPMFTPAVVLIGAGGAALLASLFTGLGAHGIYHSLEASCKNNICPSDKQQRISSGKALAVVSTVLTGAGIVAAGIGTTLLILAATHDDQHDQPPPQSNFGFAKLQLTPGPTALGIGAAASF